MKKTKLLLVLALPLIFIAGCIDGQAVISINKNGSGKATFEGIFNYPAYCAAAGMNPAQAEPFFLGQIKETIVHSDFAAWKDVSWKIFDDGRCYFKGTAYFDDISKTDFYLGSAKSNLKILFNTGDTPTLELKYSPENNPENKPLISMLNVNIVITVPAKIEKSDHFKLLDSQTAMFVIRGSDLFRSAGKLVLTPDGNDLFDYGLQVRQARKEYKRILRNIDDRLEKLNSAQGIEELESRTLNFKMRLGLAAESVNDFNEALNIYRDIADDDSADERYRAGASYQIGVCLLAMGEREKAQAQFEYVINTYPLQRAAALKSVKMLQNIRSEQPGKKEPQPESIPFVVNTSPELYLQNVDPNTTEITITFSQPMKKTDWFYSSFSRGWIPDANGIPFFDPCGVEWTLPVKLQHGKIYAIAVNYSENKKKNTQAGFRSVSGRLCEKFVLVFATLNKKEEPTFIDDEIFDKCEKINSKP